MKKTMKKILALMMAAVLIFCMFACSKKEEESNEEKDNELTASLTVKFEREEGTYEFETDENGEYIISKFIPASIKTIALELPKKISDEKTAPNVVGIGNEAFKAQNAIKSVKIPNTYTYIGSDAFYDCDALESVNMVGGITTIGENAFAKCDKLTTVKTADTIRTVSKSAFWNCVALTSIDLSASVETIEEGAFLGCSNLTKVTVSDKLNYIEKNAFFDCTKLKFAEFDNGQYLGNDSNPYIVFVKPNDPAVVSCKISDDTLIIAKDALSGCNKLETVVLGKSIKIIRGHSFENSSEIEYTEYENARYLGTKDNPYMVLMSVIITSAKSLTIHDDTKIIADTALFGCNDLLDISYGKTTKKWNDIIKTENWNYGMSIAVHCKADKNTEKNTETDN